MKRMQLGGRKAARLGLCVLLDDEDVQEMSQDRWHLNASTKGYYAARTGGILMHRQLLGVLNKGVSFDKVHGLWKAYIGDGKKRHLGWFTSKEEAAAAYDVAAKALFADFQCPMRMLKIR